MKTALSETGIRKTTEERVTHLLELRRKKEFRNVDTERGLKLIAESKESHEEKKLMTEVLGAFEAKILELKLEKKNKLIEEEKAKKLPEQEKKEDEIEKKNHQEFLKDSATVIEKKKKATERAQEKEKEKEKERELKEKKRKEEKMAEESRKKAEAEKIKTKTASKRTRKAKDPLNDMNNDDDDDQEIIMEKFRKSSRKSAPSKDYEFYEMGDDASREESMQQLASLNKKKRNEKEESENQAKKEEKLKEKEEERKREIEEERVKEEALQRQQVIALAQKNYDTRAASRQAFNTKIDVKFNTQEEKQEKEEKQKRKNFPPEKLVYNQRLSQVFLLFFCSLLFFQFFLSIFHFRREFWSRTFSPSTESSPSWTAGSVMQGAFALTSWIKFILPFLACAKWESGKSRWER